MTEVRCTNPHPRIPGRACNALIRAQFSDGDGTIECWRCRAPVYFDFRRELTSC